MKKARTKGLFLRCLPLYQSQNKVSTAPWNVSAQTLSKYHWSRELSAIPSGTLQGIWFSKYYKVLKIIRFLLLDVLIKTKKYNFLSKKLYFFQKILCAQCPPLELHSPVSNQKKESQFLLLSTIFNLDKQNIIQCFLRVYWEDHPASFFRCLSSYRETFLRIKIWFTDTH